MILKVVVVGDAVIRHPAEVFRVPLNVNYSIGYMFRWISKTTDEFSVCFAGSYSQLKALTSSNPLSNAESGTYLEVTSSSNTRWTHDVEDFFRKVARLPFFTGDACQLPTL